MIVVRSKLCSKLLIDRHTSCSTKLHVHKTPPQFCGRSTLVYIYIYRERERETEREMYIYIYIEREREREKERERGRER